MYPSTQDKLLEASELSEADSPGNGDPDTLNAERFQAIFNRYSKSILSFIYSMIRDRPCAEELCQETFIRALRKLGSKNDHTALSTWLFGIAYNVVRESVKDKYRNLCLVTLDGPISQNLETPAIRPDQQLISEELHGRIHDALVALTENQRLVFVLKIIHKLKYEEIASITGSSIAKLKTDLHRARLIMRQKLHPYLQGRTPE